MTKAPDIILHKQELPFTAKVAFGGLAGMVATTAVHPLDVVKVRLQIFHKPCTTWSMAEQLVRCQGYKALYAGLTAGLLRQATNTTTRVGVYNWLYDAYKSHYGKRPDLRDKILIGILAGLAGGLAGNPSEVVLVRMMADGPLEPCIPGRCPKRYRGAIHAFYRICKEEGVGALYRGGTLTLSRSILLSIAQLGTYAQAHQMIHERRLARGLALHVYTSLISSFFTAVLSLPIDLVKTRFQVRRDCVTQTQIFSDILKKKGVLYFWKGFVPYYIRMAIHTITTRVILEHLNKLYFQYKS